MNRLLPFLFILFFFTFFSVQATPFTDDASLQVLHEDLFKLYQKKSDQFFYSNLDSARHYLNLQKEIATASKSKVLLAKYFRNQGEFFNAHGYLGNAVQSYFEAIKLFKVANKPLHIADNLSYVGLIFLHAHDNQNALPYFESALKIYQEKGTDEEVALTHHNIGFSFMEAGDYEKAIASFKNSLRFSNKSKFWDQILKTYNILGATKFKQKLFNEAQSFYFKTLNLADSATNAEEVKAAAYNNIGESYIYQDSLKQAEEWLLKALTIKKTLNNPKFTRSTLNLLGRLYAKKDEPEKAIAFLEEGLKDIDFSVVDNEISVGLVLIIDILQKQSQRQELTPAQLKKNSQQLGHYSQMLATYFQETKEVKEKLENLNKQHILQLAVEKYTLNNKIEDSEDKRNQMRLAFIIPTIIIIAFGFIFYLAMRKIMHLQTAHDRMKRFF